MAAKLAVPILSFPLELGRADHDIAATVVDGDLLKHERIDRLPKKA
jgi:hypothetical protein